MLLQFLQRIQTSLRLSKTRDNQQSIARNRWLRISALTFLFTLCSFSFAAQASAQITWPDLTLAKVADGFSEPVHVTAANDGSGRLFVVEKVGRIKIVVAGETLTTPFLDIRDRVGASAGEQGLLSVAFAPDFADSGLFYVYYTSKQNLIDPEPDDNDPSGDNDTVVARFRVRADDPDRADPNSEERLLFANQPRTNHNGGQLAFGPDGMLYIGLGDGGGGGDPWTNGQDLTTFLGKILRIDVRAPGAYTVPAENPFVDQPDAKPEIWAYGLRNPWRFTFDRATGDLYIGDVGQNTYEEINRQPADSPGGQNYGWDITEGFHCFPINVSECGLDTYTAPIAEYNHDSGDCSVTGGVIFDSPKPDQAPVYLYGDFCSGRIRALQKDGDRYATEVLSSGARLVTSFGQDDAGNSYFVLQTGELYRLTEQYIQQHLPTLRNDK